MAEMTIERGLRPDTTQSVTSPHHTGRLTGADQALYEAATALSTGPPEARHLFLPAANDITMFRSRRTAHEKIVADGSGGESGGSAS